LELIDNISCFVFKAVSTYNLEVKWFVKVGVVFLTSTQSAFKSPLIVCNPVKVFAVFFFAVVSNVVSNSVSITLKFVPSITILLQVNVLNVKSDTVLLVVFLYLINFVMYHEQEII
jgi:hypothetical protein